MLSILGAKFAQEEVTGVTGANRAARRGQTTPGLDGSELRDSSGSSILPEAPRLISAGGRELSEEALPSSTHLLVKELHSARHSDAIGSHCIEEALHKRPRSAARGAEGRQGQVCRAPKAKAALRHTKRSLRARSWRQVPAQGSAHERVQDPVKVGKGLLGQVVANGPEEMRHAADITTSAAKSKLSRWVVDLGQQAVQATQRRSALPKKRRAGSCPARNSTKDLTRAVGLAHHA